MWFLCTLDWTRTVFKIDGSNSYAKVYQKSFRSTQPVLLKVKHFLRRCQFFNVTIFRFQTTEKQVVPCAEWCSIACTRTKTVLLPKGHACLNETFNWIISTLISIFSAFHIRDTTHWRYFIVTTNNLLKQWVYGKGIAFTPSLSRTSRVRM